jgi:hypothetical protein
VAHDPEVGGPVDGLPVLPGEGLQGTNQTTELVDRLQDIGSGVGLDRSPVRQFGPQGFTLLAQTFQALSQS